MASNDDSVVSALNQSKASASLINIIKIMTVCAVKSCHNASEKQKKSSGITFHRFPANPVDADRWIKVVRRCRHEECWKPTKTTRICSIHFKEKYIYTTKGGMRKLRHDAIPTKNLHICCPDQDATSSENSNIEDISSTERQSQSNASQATANEEEMPSNEELKPSTSQISRREDDLESFDDTPKEALLRKQLRKKTLMQIKHIKVIKSLGQKVRVLKKRNEILKAIINEFKTRQETDIDIDNEISYI